MKKLAKEQFHVDDKSAKRFIDYRKNLEGFHTKPDPNLSHYNPDIEKLF